MVGKWTQNQRPRRILKSFKEFTFFDVRTRLNKYERKRPLEPLGPIEPSGFEKNKK